MGAVQPLAAKQPAHLAGLRAALCLLQNPQSILRGELAPLRLGHDLRVRRWPRVAGSGPGGLVATLLDPQGRSVHLLQCHRFSLCGHWYSPPPPYSNSKGGRCLSEVGREGSASPMNLGVPIVNVSDHLGWRQEADRLTEAAEAILADGETYGVHLDNMETGRVRVERELSRLRHIVREDGEYASAVKKPESHSEPADTREKVEQPEPAKPAWYTPYEALRQDWNSLIEDGRQAGIPLFYAKGYMDIIPRIRELMENPDIPAKPRAPLIQVLENHQRYLSTRKHILDYPGEAERHMDGARLSPGRCG